MVKKALFLIAQKDFRDEEYQEPKKILKNNGIEVVTASTQKGTCLGKFGAKAEAELQLEEVKIIDYDVIVLIGGPGSFELSKDPAFNHIIKTAMADGKLLAAICITPMFLAKAGLLEGRKATVFASPDSLRALEQEGATYVNEDVVVDGNLITAKGPEAAAKFGEAIVKALK